MRNLIVAVAVLLMAGTASAQLVIAPGVGYISSSTEESTPNNFDIETTTTLVDFKVGYVLPMGLYLGGMYSYQSSESCNGGSCTDGSGFTIGPSIGYHSMMGFYTIFTYHIMGEEGDNPKNTGGKGPQLDLGWVFPLSSYFSIGPQLTWRSIEYDKEETSGVSVDTDQKDTSIVPYISLWFMF